MTIQKTIELMSAASASKAGSHTETTGMRSLSATVVVSVSSADLVADIEFGGTNDDPLVSTFPVLVTGALATVAPSGFTYTPATGTLAISSPGTGTHEMTISFSVFPKWFAPTYVYTSGGGTVSVRVIASGWGGC